MSNPNLFSYATSELSQDAVLCWIMAWADGRYARSESGMHKAGQALISALLTAAGADPPSGMSKIAVHRQYHDIDVLVEIDKTHVIVVENKVDTREHSDQLNRYRQFVEDRFPDYVYALVYLKLGDQSSYESVRRKGWAVFSRRDLLGTLEDAVGDVDNQIIRDYIAHLRRIQEAVDSFRLLPPSEWSARAWTGFFMTLQDELGEGEWSYVPNPQGGFMGFWWNFHPVERGEVYLQLEGDRLVAKVGVPRKEDRRQLRDRWSRIVREGIEQPRFTRPRRFGNGRWMTVAVGEPYLVAGEDGLLDLDATSAFLHRATSALTRVVEDEDSDGS